MTVGEVFSDDSEPTLQAEFVKRFFVERYVDRVHIVSIAKATKVLHWSIIPRSQDEDASLTDLR